MRNGSAQRVAVSGLLTSLMLVLGLIERQFPLTAAIPGIKLGLANSVLIYALYMLGVKQSIVLMLLKAMMRRSFFFSMDYASAAAPAPSSATSTSLVPLLHRRSS